MTDKQVFITGGGNLTPLFQNYFGGESLNGSSPLVYFNREVLKKNCSCTPSLLPLDSPLDVLVDEYRKALWIRCEACLMMLQNTLEFIVGDINDKFPICEPPFRRSTHQYCMPSATVMAACELFEKEKGSLDAANSFEGLVSLVWELTSKHLPSIERKSSNPHKENARSNHFKDLAVYDFALRYGYHRMGNTLHAEYDLYPKSIYLHAGALKGARGLWKILRLDEKYIKHPKSVSGESLFIPFETFKKLTGNMSGICDLSPEGKYTKGEQAILDAHLPLHIENFLCIFHDNLRALGGILSTEEEEEYYNKLRKLKI